MNVEAYLQRIGYEGPREPTLETLRALHLTHLYTVPFENLDIHWGTPILLDHARLYDKVVAHRRGGFCYELNGLFAELLRALGYRVALLSARVRMSEGEGFGPAFDHLVLRVDLDEPWLADVGFGEGFREPLRLVEVVEQAQPLGAYRLRRDGDQWTYEARDSESGEWEPQYLFTLQPCAFPDFAEMCNFQQTSPESHFTQKRVCTLATPEGRITLRDTRLIVTRHGERVEHEIRGEDEFHAALWEWFGVRVCIRVGGKYGTL